MIFNFLIQLFVAVALSAVSYALAPKPPPPPPPQARQRSGSPLQQFDAPTADAGRPIPVVFGTVVIRSPNVLHFAEKSSVAIQEETKAEYRMSIHYGICQGRIDSIRRVRISEKTMLADPGKDVKVNLPNFHGGEDKQGGIRGRFLWQDGSFTQTIPTGMAESYGNSPSAMPSYRGLATVMFKGQGTSGNPRPEPEEDPDNPGQPVFDGHNPGNGFLWGQSPFIPPSDFMVTRITDVQPGWLDSRRQVDLPANVSRTLTDEVTGVSSTLGPNCNPIHVLRECLLNDIWGVGMPEGILDDASFKQAAITVHQEGLGVSFQFSSAEGGEEIVSTILEHIEAVLYLSPLTGLVTVEVLRGGYTKSSLDLYDDTSSKVISVARKNSGEITNEVVVQWTNPSNEKTEPVSLQNLAGISRAGAVISNSISYPGIRDIETAWKVAERELAATSEQTMAVELELDRRAWGMVPGDVFRLTSDENDIDDVVLRALRVDYGRPGEDRIRVNCVEDVFGRTTPNFENPTQGACPTNPRRFNITQEDGAVVLRWEVPREDGGSPILGYEFQQDGGEWVRIPGGASARSHRISDLTNGETHVWRVRAYNAVCPGLPSIARRSGPDNVTLKGPTVPLDFRAIAVGTEMELHWSDPESDGGASIIRFEYSLDMGATWIVIPEEDNYLHRVLGLEANRQYPVRIRGVNIIGPGAETFDIHVTIRDLLAFGYEHPPQAEGLYGRGGIMTALLWWDNPYSHYQNHAVTIIYRHDEDDFSSATQVGRSPGISLVDEDVEAGTWYYWIAWQSQSSVVGDASDADLDIDGVQGVVVEVSESPAAAIARISAEILADPLTGDLLSPIDGLDRIPDIQRIAVPAQEISRSLVEGYFRITGIIVDTVQTNEADARQLLSARTDELEEEIDSSASAITALQTDLDLKANVTALDALAVRVVQTETTIDAHGTSIDALDATISGVTLGPTQNVFSGAGRTQAENARNVYADTNASWLAEYDADPNLHIELRWEYLRVYQHRVDNNWVDHGFPHVRASAIQGLDVRVRQTESSISSQSTALTNLRSEITDLDAAVFGFPLGETPNSFMGDSKTAAAMARDTYAADNATWLAGYDGNDGAHIQLLYDGKVQYQNRQSNRWEDVGDEFTPALALATAFDALQTRVEQTETDITSTASDVTALTATVGDKADATALTSLTSRVQTVEGDTSTNTGNISANTTAITQLTSTVAGKADATAVTRLTTRVEATETTNTTQAREISALETSVSDLDSRIVGRTLGPEQNVFTGATKEVAETARNTYSTANPTWLPQYDADANLNIELRFGSLYQYQRRVENAWQDNGEALVRAAALSNLATQVSANEDAIEANATDITQLETDLDDKASAQAVTDLTARVATTETSTTSNASAVTQLRSSLGKRVDTLTFQIAASQLTAFTNALVPGSVLRAGAAGDLDNWIVQTVEIDGNKFTVAVTG